MTLSRRNFLQLSSAALLSVRFASEIRLFEPFASTNATYGRAFGAATVQSASGEEIGQLWPNSVVRLLDADERWYRIDSGYVLRENLQPMNLYATSGEFPAMPFTAEVSAPQAVIRENCAAEAGIVTTIGHGGAARVVHRMPDGRGGGDWLGVELAGERQGWTQAAHWRPVGDAMTQSSAHRALEIDQRDFTLTALENDMPVLIAPFAAGAALTAGRYSLTGRECAGVCGGYYGVPWPLAVDRLGEIVGAYWHNRFGGMVEGAAIQAAPPVAKWLNGWLSDDAEITVR